MPTLVTGATGFLGSYLVELYDYRRASDELGLRCRPLIETLHDTVAWLRTEAQGRAAVA